MPAGSGCGSGGSRGWGARLEVSVRDSQQRCLHCQGRRPIHRGLPFGPTTCQVPQVCLVCGADTAQVGFGALGPQVPEKGRRGGGRLGGKSLKMRHWLGEPSRQEGQACPQSHQDRETSSEEGEQGTPRSQGSQGGGRREAQEAPGAVKCRQEERGHGERGEGGRPPPAGTPRGQTTKRGQRVAHWPPTISCMYLFLKNALRKNK